MGGSAIKDFCGLSSKIGTQIEPSHGLLRIWNSVGPVNPKATNQ